MASLWVKWTISNSAMVRCLRLSLNLFVAMKYLLSNPLFLLLINLMELLLMVDAAKRASASSINVVIPYFGYARQDRKDKPRVAIAAKLIANLISAAGATRIMACDLHADQIQGFFDIPVDHLDGSYIFVPYLKSLGLSDIMFASPDVGGIKRARSFAKFFDAELAVCDKYRKEANKVESMRLIGEVEGKDVVLVDDLVDTAGTICKAAALLKEKGAKTVRAVCTHAVLIRKGLRKYRKFCTWKKLQYPIQFL